MEVQLHSLLTSGLMSMSDQPHALPALPSGKEPHKLTEERPGWNPETVLVFTKRDKSLGSDVIRTQDRPSRSLATILTPSRFKYTNPRVQLQKRQAGRAAKKFTLLALYKSVLTFLNLSKGKVIPLQDWTGPEGSRRLRLTDFKTIGM